ncbi:MAG: FHA domain-containing protein [Methyloprofundus sp.]|nr:FHA domain-containing protein [Methyloprofundus sp.]
MAKFTVFFKDKPIHSEIFESGIVHIGRDETNELSIDSLAIAPAHAAAVISDTKVIIKQLSTDFPLVINEQPQKACQLKNGDVISLGKHRIIYNDTEALAPTATNDIENKTLNQELSNSTSIPEANLQVMAGKYIGRLVPLKKTMTRLGHTGAGLIIVTRRKDGYYASMLEPNDDVKINDTPLGENTVLLTNNDILLIDNIPMQFYMA